MLKIHSIIFKVYIFNLAKITTFAECLPMKFRSENILKQTYLPPVYLHIKHCLFMINTQKTNIPMHLPLEGLSEAIFIDKKLSK